MMTDIHCHILPGVDDGAQSMEDALEMARMAVDCGVEAIIATPHCNLPDEEEKNYTSAALLNRFDDFRRALREAEIPLTLLNGCEVLGTPEVPVLVREGKLLTLAGGPYLLIEFFFDEDPDYMDDLLAAVAEAGLIPVIAHPERYEAVQHMPRIIERWFRTGYIIQVNKGSLLGRLGRRAESTAVWILSRGLAHVVASDAHSSVYRTPHTVELIDCLLDLCGEAYTDILLDENPGRIARGQPILQA